VLFRSWSSTYIIVLLSILRNLHRKAIKVTTIIEYPDRGIIATGAPVAMATSVKTVKKVNTNLKTVGCVKNRYRLGHRWVSAKMLNV